MTGQDRSRVEIVALAICLLSGEGQFVDIEDIAAAANNLAPGRFTWKRYPDQIDINAVRRCLLAAAKPKNGNLVTGSMRTGWALTEHGAEFARNHEEYHHGGELLVTGLSKEESRFLAWQKKRIQAHPAYKKVAGGLAREVTSRDAESFFLLDRATQASARKQKIEQYIRCFANDPEICPVIRLIAQKAGVEVT
jgi:hypothetical protein